MSDDATTERTNTMTIIDYDPTKGVACQGDVIILPVPDGIRISEAEEIAPEKGKLILQHGEVTGHHHHIEVNDGPSRAFRTEAAETSYADALSGASPGLRKRLSGGAKAKAGTARLYRDPSAAQAVVDAGILERADLCVGFLRIEGAPMVLRHQEHDGIRLPIGTFYIGRQVESSGAEERRVED